MLSKEENELLCRVGPGTPMGNLMRRYWLPALMSWELPTPDCAPLRVRLLGEDLVAFRDTQGRVGMLEEGCPHRIASLWLGRNENNGLRCVYHGWQFDVDGNCTDQMNEPESFANKIKAVAYPAIERGGVIWTYMGPAELQPAAPDFEYTRVVSEKRTVSKVWEECSWLQALEGGIDSSHAPILHRALPGGTGGIASNSAFVRGKAPTLEVDFTDYGYRYTGVRELGEDEQYVRGYHFVMPFTQLRPGQNVSRGADVPERPMVSGHHWVPIDDNNCMVWNWHYSYGDHVLEGDEIAMDSSGNGPSFVDPKNQFRAYGNMRNDWNIDREVQKTQTFTGIPGINQQDRAVQESMGPIVDRSREHLGPADRAIISARRILTNAVRAVERGETPDGVGPSYYSIRASEKIFARDIPWRDVMLPEMYPEGESQKVEATVPRGLSGEGLTRRVAHYATALRYESISPEVIDRAKQLLLDYLGVAIGGRMLAASSPALVRGVRALTAGATGNASVVGEGDGFAAHYAALLNAGFAHSMDFDDTHRDAIIHQGTPLFAALLALGETAGASGRDVLTAAVAGYEVGGKLGRAHGDKVHLRGFHPSATTGIFAVTAAAGRLQGMDEATIESALGLDLTMAAGNQQFTEGGGANKPLQVGMAAHNAIYSIALAQAGLHGSTCALEGRLGYYATYAEPGSDLDHVVLDLEAPGEVLQVGLKPYPSCRYSHAAIDGVMTVMSQQGLAAEDVESIDLAIPAAGYQLIGADPGLKRRPASVTEAQFSIYFAAAATAVDGAYTWQSYEKLNDSRVQRVMDRTNVSIAPDLTGMQARLNLAGRGGRWALDITYPKGEPELPLTWSEVEAKFLSLATHLLDDGTARLVIERVRSFESLADVSVLMGLLRGK